MSASNKEKKSRKSDVIQLFLCGGVWGQNKDRVYILWDCFSYNTISPWLFNCSTENGKVNKSDWSSVSLFARLIIVIVTGVFCSLTLCTSARAHTYTHHPKEKQLKKTKKKRRKRKITTIISFVFKFFTPDSCDLQWMTQSKAK